MAQWLRACLASAEDTSSIPITQCPVLTTAPNSSSRGPDVSGRPWAPACAHTHTKTHTGKLNL